MRTEAELDALHESVVTRYPGGLTLAQFKKCALESADEDGRIYPPSISGGMVQSRPILFSMWLRDKTIEPGWRGYNKPMWWRITNAGRRALAEAESK